MYRKHLLFQLFKTMALINKLEALLLFQDLRKHKDTTFTLSLLILII